MSTENLCFALPHPRVPHPHPLDNSKPRQGLGILGPVSGNELSVTHPPLFPQCRALLLLDETVEFALDALEAAPLTGGELSVETLPYLLPLLTEVNAVVPYEVHLLFFVFGSWWAATFGDSGRVAGDGVEALAPVRSRRGMCGSRSVCQTRLLVV